MNSTVREFVYIFAVLIFFSHSLTIPIYSFIVGMVITLVTGNFNTTFIHV